MFQGKAVQIARGPPGIAPGMLPALRRQVVRADRPRAPGIAPGIEAGIVYGKWSVKIARGPPGIAPRIAAGIVYGKCFVQIAQGNAVQIARGPPGIARGIAAGIVHGTRPWPTGFTI